MYRITELYTTLVITSTAYDRATVGVAQTVEEEAALEWTFIELTTRIFISATRYRFTTDKITSIFSHLRPRLMHPRVQRASAYVIRRPQQVLDRLEDRGLIRRVRGGIMHTRRT